MALPVSVGGTITIATVAPATAALGGTGVGQILAQSFKGLSAINSTIIYIRKLGTPTDNVFVEIRSGSQTGTLLGTSDNVVGSGIPTTETATTWNFSTPVTGLDSSTTYWAVIKRSGALNSSNQWLISVDTAAPYADGTQSDFNGTVWTNRANDIRMSITQLGISTAVAPVGPFKTSGIISAGATIYSIATGGGFYGQFGNSIAAAAFQSFTVSAGATVGSVIFQLSKTGSPTDNLTATIYAADGSNQPTGSVLGTSNTVSGTFTIGLVEFTFATPVTLASAGKYTAVLKRTTIDDANCYRAHHGNNDFDATQSHGYGDIGSWTIPAYDIYLIVKAAPTVLPDAYYFFGRDGTTATTLQAFKALSSGYVVTGTGTAGGATACGSTASNYRHAQTWTTDAAAAPISDISFIVGKVGSPTENVRVEIFATSAGAPTGTALATSNVVAAASIIAGGSLTIFSFPTPFVPSASTQYAAVFTKATTTSDASNYYQIYAAAASGTSTYAGGNRYTGSSTNWLSQTNDWSVVINALAPGDPDTSWASITTKTGFTTAILNLAGYQVGSTIHLLVNDGTASTLFATKYVSYDALTDTFLATVETVSAAVAVTGQIAGAGAGASLVVRGNGEVVAFYSGVQAKVSGTFRAHVYYRRRTAVNTWSTETMVDPNTAVDNNAPTACLGASDRVHFSWNNQTGVAYRTLSAANALNTAASSLAMSGPGDAVSYNRAGTTKVIVTSNDTSQSAMRFDSADNPTVSFASALATNTTTPHRIGVDPVTLDVTIVYRSSVDSDLYAIKSTNDGAAFGAPVSFFVGTVAASDANLSKSSTGSLYSRGGSDVVGYIVNDNGTWKYNESVVRAPATADAWNVNDKSTNTVLSNGDKTANNPSTTSAVRSTTKRLNGAAGKYYAEIQTVTKFAISSCNVGIKDASAAVSGTPFAARVNGFGDIYIGDTYSGITTAAPADGGVISLAWDTGAKLFWVRTTRDWNDNVANDPATGVGGIDFSSAAAVDHALWSQNGTFTIRTRAAELTQTAPSGFLSWMGETLTVANNGALAAATSSVSGSGIVASAGTGTLNAQSATTVGQGVVASVGTGALSAVPTGRTNLIKQSQALETWSLNAATVTPDLIAAPDSTVTADRVTDAAISSGHYLYPAPIPYVVDDVFTFSVYVKAGTISWVSLGGSVSTLRWVNFDLASGQVGTKSYAGIVANIYALPDGWFRCTATLPAALDAGSAYASVYLLLGDNPPSTQYVGGSGTLYVWGAQFEKGSVATAYIPTTTATVTTSETLVGTGIASWNATGALSASVASASGAGQVQSPPVTGTGVLTTSVAALVSSGVASSTGTAVLVAPNRTMAGPGTSQSVQTLATLTAQTHTSTGVGLSESKQTSSALATSITLLSSSGLSSSAGTASLTASVATLVGISALAPVTGTLPAQSAIAVGIGISESRSTFGALPSVGATLSGIGIGTASGTGTLSVLTLSTLVGVGVSRSVSTFGALAPLAAVTTGAGLSRSVSTSASLSVSAAAIGSVGISQTTGTGTLACSVATLVGVGLNTATGTGALTSFATLSGSGVARWVGTGILSASTAIVVSTGITQWIATGTLNSNFSTLAGAGASSSTQTASALQASLASVSGFQGVVIVSGVGTLQSQSAAAVGVAVSRSLGTGALLDATAALAGAGLSGTQGASLLVPTACVITASGKSISSGTATLSAGISVASGVGGIAAAPTGTGILLSGASSVAGVGGAALTASGILNAQSATVSGSGAATWIASGILASSVSVAAGAGFARWSGLGVLTSVAATTASLGASSSAGSASLLSARASVFGAEGVVVVQGAGALQAQSRIITGVGAARHHGTGVLLSQDRILTGAGLGRSFGTGSLTTSRSVLDAIVVVQATGSGLLAAKRALMAGFASLTAYGNGELVTISAVISGNDFVKGLGVLPSSYSTLAGEGNVGYPAYPEPDPLPGSYPGTTTWVYAGTAGWVNPGTRGWVNPGTAEWRKRAA
jgi:hypothetical protein